MIRQLIEQCLTLLVFRGLPFAVYGLFAKAVPRRAGLLSAAFYVAAVMTSIALASSARWSSVRLTAIAYAFFTTSAFVVFGLGQLYRHSLLSRSAAFVACLAIFGALGSLVLPQAAGLLVTVQGWELAMASFSWIVDGTRTPATRLRDCLHFLLVNPVLVYADRGKRLSDAPSLRDTAGRCALGILGFCAHLWVLHQGERIEAWAASTAHGGVAATGILLCYLVILAASVYFAHSSVASISIAWLRYLGWQIPERYDYPFLSSQPLEFWRRWNRYAGSWARRYVFQPLLLHFKRRGWAPSFAEAVAVGLTFAAMGAMHDAAGLFQGVPPTLLPMTMAFIANGVLLAVWKGGSRVVQRSSRARSQSIFAARTSRVLGWGLCQLTLLLCVFALPVALRGNLDAELGAVLHSLSR
jgi:D-alanyl-lipoteichoic acid acyltransferase DltB (MBOAT superfamily)